MTATQEHGSDVGTECHFDVAIIGSGVTGLYQLKTLRDRGLTVRTFEAGSGVGGTWYWNRYPGARFDSESWTYAYSFSKELLEEWDWVENYSAQPETERYLNYVADKFDLRRDIQFDSTVAAAHYLEAERCWRIVLESGESYLTRFLVTALGILSAPTVPSIPDAALFEGQSLHTHRWPHEGVDLTGKRVGIIGTGATGVQTIQTIAKTVGHLTVFQRTPNWCKPLLNTQISKPEMEAIRGRYPEIFDRCSETPGCYIHGPDPRKTLQTPKLEREAFWQQLYDTPGFAAWQANFRDMLTDYEANALASEFFAGKIRERVHDPVTAERLIPKNHGFGTRRPPLENGYYEVYNQPNVDLVDISETPIERFTVSGVQTTAGHHELDVMIYATGFDAITGAFDRIDIRGVGGVRLKDKWQDGPQTYLGVFVSGFPNLLMAMGPHAGLGNYTRAAEYSVEWVTEVLQFATDRKLTRIEATEESAAEWTGYVQELGENLLSNHVNSWLTGVNSNVEGKAIPRVLRWGAGHPAYREYCDGIAAGGYATLLTD